MNIMKREIIRVICLGILIPNIGWVIYIPSPIRAAEVIQPSRDEVINLTLERLQSRSKTTPPIELEQIHLSLKKLKTYTNDMLLAKAIHLYNQGKLEQVKGILKDVVTSAPEYQSTSNLIREAEEKGLAEKKSIEQLVEEKRGIESVERAKMGWLYGKEEFGDTEGIDNFSSQTTFTSYKANKVGRDLSKNHSISQAYKMEGTLADFKYTATLNLNYFNKNDEREDIRVRRATWWMQNEKLRFILGDTSTYLSRYILNGINYRGVNLKMKLYEDMFKEKTDNLIMLYGKIPYFDLTVDSYVYPREIVGVRNEFSFGSYWKFNTNFAYIWDNEPRIKKISSTNKPKENGLVGIDQKISIIPGRWTLWGETTFSYSDDQRKAENKILRDSAHLYVSEFKTKKFKLHNSYERVNPDFRSYVGITGFIANRQLTTDREHLLNTLTYTPKDNIDIGLHYSRLRTNLANKHNVESIVDENYKFHFRFEPKGVLPVFSLRSSFLTSTSTPGAIDKPRKNSSWNTVIGLFKKFWDTDIGLSFGLSRFSQYINSTNSYGDAIGYSFSLSAHRSFLERFYLSSSYSFQRSRLKKRPENYLARINTHKHLFSLNFSSKLWDTASLTLNYNINRVEDLAFPDSWEGINHSFSTTFSWPFTTMIGPNKKLVFSPFISYYYSDGSVTLLDRRYLALSLESDYYLTENSKLSLSGEYRDNFAQDPTYTGFGDEYRFILSYKSY